VRSSVAHRLLFASIERTLVLISSCYSGLEPPRSGAEPARQSLLHCAGAGAARGGSKIALGRKLVSGPARSSKAFEGPIIEVHISNIHARDELHRHSKLPAAVKAVICGLGPYGYIVAMQAALHILKQLPATLPNPIRVGP
jgi:Dehydroquinase class II